MPKEAKQPADENLGKSRFYEHMSTSSIRPPPDELWKDLDLGPVIDRFNAECLATIPAPAWSVAHDMAAAAASSTVAPKRPAAASRTPSATTASSHHTTRIALEPTSANEGPFSRLSRALTSWFNGASSLGKRKAGSETAEKATSDTAAVDRRKEVEEAYRVAKEHGLLPTPKVFVRPALAAHRARAMNSASSALYSPTASATTSFVPANSPSVTSIYVTANHASTPVPATPTPNGFTFATTPRTPALYKTPSKRDLNKQRKLSKRVSDLEHKLQEARKELSLALGPHNPNPVPPLPALPTNLPPTPTMSPHEAASATYLDFKIVKKRKTALEGDHDGEYQPIPTETETETDLSVAQTSDSDAQSTKRSRTTPSKKLVKNKYIALRKRSTSGKKAEKDHIVTVAPDGVAVPPVPDIPNGVKGKRAGVSDDGYGGLEHEMF
ncbi:hypothetical protein PMIN01_10014 [Paraphaeosphaeria minitans]|uniref:Uncharacterized protein n=1 Tax=Paraphaeosphaeria minitans TaxID=565426 RepID=A0A9P6KMM0_9PLEO|nr:hypothetical protein PMIN01_10014 [Paraphaeosphaeria minitans]